MLIKWFCWILPFLKKYFRLEIRLIFVLGFDGFENGQWVSNIFVAGFNMVAEQL